MKVTGLFLDSQSSSRPFKILLSDQVEVIWLRWKSLSRNYACLQCRPKPSSIITQTESGYLGPLHVNVESHALGLIATINHRPLLEKFSPTQSASYLWVCVMNVSPTRQLLPVLFTKLLELASCVNTEKLTSPLCMPTSQSSKQLVHVYLVQRSIVVS